MRIFKNKELVDYTSFKIGGKARYFVEIENLEDLEKFLNFNFKDKIFILGGGTNILINNFDGIVLKPNFKHIEKVEEGVLKVGASNLVSEVLDYAIKMGYQGLEWAGGLPGTIGGAVEGGVGCFGGEFKNLVLEIEALNLKSGEYKIFKKEECEFEYRNSFFKKNKDWLIVSAKLIFNPKGESENIKRITEEKIKYRKLKHPIEYPNAGSVFKNYPFFTAPKKIQELALEKNKVKNDPFPVIPMAFLISEAGLAGKRIGDAQISLKHANFIINLGKAKFEDVLSLIDFTKKTLQDKFEINPELEIRIIV